MSWIKNTFNRLLELSKSSKKQKEFGYLLLIVMALIFGYKYYKNGLNFNIQTNILITVFIITLLITLVFRTLFLPILFVWLLIGEILGVITSTLIMGIVYFLIFSPIVLCIRFFRKENVYKPGWKAVNRTIDYTKLS